MSAIEYDDDKVNDTMNTDDATISRLMNVAQYFITQKQNGNVKKTDFYQKIKSCINITFGPSNKIYHQINKYYPHIPTQLNEALVFYIMYYYYTNKKSPSDQTIEQTIIPNVLPQRYMDIWMGLEDKSKSGTSQPAHNICEYKKDDDEQMEGLEDNTGDTSHTIPQNNDSGISLEISPRKIKIAFLGISYDPKMHVDKEANYIRVYSDFDVTPSGFTKEELENALITSPNIIHISTHGRDRNQFEISLEEPHLLRYLVDNHPKYSAYYAAIAVFFEMEIDHFVEFGSRQNNNKTEIKCELLADHKIYKMLQCIADRYGCFCIKKNNTHVEISWGKGQDSQFMPPHKPVEFSTFTSIYSNDHVVKPIIDQITHTYKKNKKTYDCSVSSVSEYQRFAWDILSVLLQKMILKHYIETPDDDDAKTDTINISGENANIQITQNKIGRNQELTRELYIMPNMSEKIYFQLDLKKRQKINKKLNLLQKEILEDFDLKDHDYHQCDANIHVVRFKDECALKAAIEKIDNTHTDSKYKDFKIYFSSLPEAQNISKQTVGFIPKTEEKIYAIDTKNQTDEISLLIKRCLKTRNECKIKLIVLNACNSYMLGKIFSEYIENVICIHPYVKILDSTANTLTKYFYESLQKYIHANPNMLFSDCVFKAYSEAKQHIAKKCENDFACSSHSHLPHCIPGETQTNDLYDGKTLIISNVSISDMRELHRHLSNGQPGAGANEDQKEQFVKKTLYYKNFFDELSNGYFKFETKTDRNEAQKILCEKQNDDFKCMEHETNTVKLTNVGWTHRIVPDCCCSPNYPHTVEDKFILLQNGNIINGETKTKK